MTYEEVVSAVREAAQKADASSIKEHVAIQFNITGEGEGIFYLEIVNGEIKVEPYEYYDRDAIITGSAENILMVLRGKLDPILAYTFHKIEAHGNLEKALILKEIVK